MAQPVVNDTKRVPLVLKFLYFLKGRLVTKYNKHLTTFNLALEGAINRVDDISIKKSRKILDETKKIIVSMENAESDLAKSNYLDSEEVKENISEEKVNAIRNELRNSCYLSFTLGGFLSEIEQDYFKLELAKELAAKTYDLENLKIYSLGFKTNEFRNEYLNYIKQFE